MFFYSLIEIENLLTTETLERKEFNILS